MAEVRKYRTEGGGSFRDAIRAAMGEKIQPPVPGVQAAGNDKPATPQVGTSGVGAASLSYVDGFATRTSVSGTMPVVDGFTFRPAPKDTQGTDESAE